jgi:hypothetical protein
MKIVGYSERGAMNALFYGMAFDKENGEELVRLFLELAKIEEASSFSDFEFYNEFSLSEFGEPDLVIIAKKNKNPVVFFVEAKVSEGASYNIEKQKRNHNKDIIAYEHTKCHQKGDASNLFFQLRLKNYFFEQRKSIIEPIGGLNGKAIGEHECIEKTKDRNGKIRFRKLGANPIVIKFAEIIKPCVEAYYIAIVPKQEKENPIDYPINCSKKKTMRINFVSWEAIWEKGLGQLKDTFEFNKVGELSQILNRPNKK